MYARFVPRVPRKVIAIEVTHSPYNSNPRTRLTAPLCQAFKAVITRHVVSVGQTATGASSRSRLISAGDSIAQRYRVVFAENASRKSETHETRFLLLRNRNQPSKVHRFLEQYARMGRELINNV